jgi:ataxin-3
MAAAKQYWVYHERQEALLCGQHALNNLVQRNVFSAGSLAEIAEQLDQMELNYMAQNNEGGTQSKDFMKRVAEGSGNVDESGNFSIEVLRSALMNSYNLELPSLRQKGVGDARDVTEFEGFICNRSSHWFAIRKINGRFYNLNSTLEQPEIISHFKLAAEMEALQNAGYSVFCVVDSLPPPCTSQEMMESGLLQYWWREEDLIQGKTDSTTTRRDNDPWKKVGSGRRLDGKRPGSGGSSSSSSGGGGLEKSVSEMTEDEMMQMAMAASLEQQSAPSIGESAYEFELTTEPLEGAPGAVKIQFRLPDGTRAMRRFDSSDRVGALYAFMASKCPKQRIELRAGFPPSDISSQRDSSIAESKLAGEMIHGRYI